MDLRKIKKLIDLLEESNLSEIEIKEGEESVRLARLPKGGLVAAPAQVMQHVAAPAPVMPMQSPVQAATGGSHKPAGPELPPGHVVRAPMVGTFYTSPSPDKPGRAWPPPWSRIRATSPCPLACPPGSLRMHP